MWADDQKKGAGIDPKDKAVDADIEMIGIGWFSRQGGDTLEFLGVAPEAVFRAVPTINR
jgi:hypothetical protein